MKIKTAQLIDAALDWAVALARDESVRVELGRVRFALSQFTNDYDLYSPSTDWAQGGPIIDNIKGLQFKHWLGSKPGTCCEAHIHNYEGDWVQFGPTTLIAAMRCYVDSELGDEVDVPEELL